MSISGEKDALRAQLRARLSQSDPAENAACDVRITLQVLSLPAFQAAERTTAQGGVSAAAAGTMTAFWRVWTAAPWG